MSEMLLNVGGDRVYNAARTPARDTWDIVLKENMRIHSIIWNLPWLDDGWELLLEGNGKNQCFCFVLFCFLVDVC